MVRQAHEAESDRVDRAFNRVLAAEAEARERVEECRKEAAAILAAAEEQARRIADRTDRRELRVHRVADAGVERALAELRTISVEAEPLALEGDTLARLDRAIDALVAEILAPEARSVRGAEP